MDQKWFDLEASSQPGQFNAFDMQIFVPEIEKLEPNDIYLEIGVDRGRSLSVVDQIAKEGVLIYGIDPVLTPEFDLYLKNNHRVEFWNMKSVEVAKHWNREINLLFVDGNHAYDFVKEDIEYWYPKMKKNGVMLFHDYDTSSPGVVQAVDEFVAKYHLVLERLIKRSSVAKIQL